MPAIYYKSRLLTEYLIDVKGYTYDRILNEEIAEEDLFYELVNWAQLNREGQPKE